MIRLEARYWLHQEEIRRAREQRATGIYNTLAALIVAGIWTYNSIAFAQYITR